MNVHTKFEVRSFTHSSDNTGYSKIWAVPGHAYARFSPRFVMGFCSDGPYECIAKFEFSSFTRS